MRAQIIQTKKALFANDSSDLMTPVWAYAVAAQ